MLGLVLTAGGARGAYQAGVLKRIGEIPVLRRAPCPFKIVTGASAGAINGAMLAAKSASFRDGTQLLAKLWSDLSVEKVFKADMLSLARSSVTLMRDLALMSYLLFDSAYTRELIYIGYRDASERIDEIEEFLVGKRSAAERTARRPVRRLAAAPRLSARRLSLST